MNKNIVIIILLFLEVCLVSCTRNGFEKDLNNNQLPMKAKNSEEPILVKEVNVEIAKEVAKVFFAETTDKKIENIEVKNIDSIVDVNNHTAMYIFNMSPQGFVITSANIKNEPIIGFSKRGNINLQDETDVPSSFLSFLQETAVVNHIIATNDEDPFREYQWENIGEWQVFLCKAAYKKFSIKIEIFEDPCRNAPRKLIDSTIVSTIGFFCKTNWGQGEPYNYYIFGHRYAGCVAVAMGQIMRVHQYPRWIEWSIMPIACTNSYNNATSGEKEVAGLLANIGFNVQMIYGHNGSSAADFMARISFVINYNYSHSADLDPWNYNRIINQLKNDKIPIYAGGYQPKACWLYKKFPTNGHVYVLDGLKTMVRTYEYECLGKTYTYKTERDLIHYNFGWGDRLKPNEEGYNGWYSNNIAFLLNNATTIDMLLNKHFPNYEYKKICIYDIKPR